MRRPLWIIALLALAGLTACTVSLAADVTPPPNYQPPAEPAQPAALTTALPMVPSDPAAGQALYAEKCLPCHGETGQGDGPQAADLPNPPAMIGSPELARQRRPTDWYALVTQGNLQKFMPGFSGSLSDRQRWDVVAYTVSLSLAGEDIALGQSVYNQYCAACHGETGRGDGPDAAGAVPGWDDPARLAALSAAEMSALILNGSGGAMPAFADRLSPEQAWAAAAYTRMLGFAGGTPAGQQAGQPGTTPAADAATLPAATAAAAASVESGLPAAVQVSGQIINGSSGDPVAGVWVKLVGFDQMQAAYEQTAQVNPDGSFVFEDVELAPERVFMATTEYNGRPFNSDIYAAEDLSKATARLTLPVYETSTDISPLVADRMHVFFDLSKPGILQVGELFIISNPTTDMLVAAEEGGPVLTFDLPTGAANLSFEDGVIGERYVQTQNGFGDTYPILPGSGTHQVLFAYELPYERKAQVSLPIPLPVGSAVIIAPTGGVKLESTQLMDMGEQEMQGVAMHLYTASAIPAGGTLDVTLSGQAGDATSAGSGAQTGLLVGAGALLLAAGGAGWWVIQKRREQDEQELEEEPDSGDAATTEDLLDAIVALDDLYQSGQLPKEAYQQRRAALKERLRTARAGSSREA